MTDFSSRCVTAPATGPANACVLVLHDGDERDVKGIWGPYTSVDHAAEVLTELQQWPLDGRWVIYDLKHYQGGPATASSAPSTLPEWPGSHA